MALVIALALASRCCLALFVVLRSHVAVAVAIEFALVATQRIVDGSRCCSRLFGGWLSLLHSWLLHVAGLLLAGGGVGIDVLLFAWLGSDGRGVMVLLLFLRQFTVMVEC